MSDICCCCCKCPNKVETKEPSPVITPLPVPNSQGFTTSSFVKEKLWNCSLPTQDPSSSSPKVKTITFPELETYSDENYKITSRGIEMYGPVGGVTTPNSKNPRCEFRELNKDGSKASWDTTKGEHTIDYVFSVLSLPQKKPEICVVQVHDLKDDIFEVRVEGKKVVVEGECLKNLYGDGKNVFMTNLEMNKPYKVQLKIKDGKCSITIENTVVVFNVRTKGCYFKAGCYTQANLSNDVLGSKGGILVSHLSVNHVY